ncbi:MAG: thioredoxin domain-containing protein [Sphingobium sp.]|nr:thioredoxin domain-containing protein [Sphingobium sp.]
MTPRLLLKILILMLAPLLAAPLAAQTKAAAVDWTRTITVTPKGGFILGNPNARTKLVEYMSYSCPHCADFAKEATEQLKTGWIKRGALSIEYRNFIRDPFDLSAALVARCGGQPRFLANHEAIFSTYDGWIAKADDYAKNPLKTEDRAAQLADIADKVGFIALAGKNGLSADATRKCIADPNAMATVLAMTAGAWDIAPDFEGTPTFVLDGKVLKGIHGWAGLKPLLPPLPAPGK